MARKKTFLTQGLLEMVFKSLVLRVLRVIWPPFGPWVSRPPLGNPLAWKQTRDTCPASCYLGLPQAELPPGAPHEQNCHLGLPTSRIITWDSPQAELPFRAPHKQHCYLGPPTSRIATWASPRRTATCETTSGP